jgi:hypothetical protein
MVEKSYGKQAQDNRLGRAPEPNVLVQGVHGHNQDGQERFSHAY